MARLIRNRFQDGASKQQLAAEIQAAARIAQVAIGMLEAVETLENGLRVRIGLHSGEVVAGVIGTSRFSYDLWGDTVNTASRLESSGKPGTIHCSEAFGSLVRDQFQFEDIGLVHLKGKGAVHTYFLSGRRHHVARLGRG